MSMKVAVSLCCGDCNAVTSDEFCLILEESVKGYATSDKGIHPNCRLPDVELQWKGKK